MRLYLKIIAGFLFCIVIINPAFSQINDLFVTPPGKRTLNPNTFPSFVFSLSNRSDIKHELTFRLVLPADWSVITFQCPSVIASQEILKVHITLAIPQNARADSTYRLGLITKWKTGSDTSFTEININPRSAVKLLSFIAEKQTVSGKVDSLNYVIQNNGNGTDTLRLIAELPAEWKLIELFDRLIMPPQEKTVVCLVFKSPESATPDSRASITLIVASQVAQNKGIDISDKNVTSIHIIQDRNRKASGSLHPVIPINIGFSINRIAQGSYPGVQLFLNTGMVNLGAYSTQIELTRRLMPGPVAQPPQFVTDRIKFELAAKKWNVVAGDVLVESNPLMNKTTPLGLADNQIMGEVCRGYGLKFKFDKANISVFHGKRLFSDYTVSSASVDLPVSDQLEMSSSYLAKDKSQLVTMEGIFDTKKNSSIGALAGISKSQTISGMAQLRALATIKSMSLMGRLHWAGDSYTGDEKGQYGAVFTTRWIPKPFIYLWGNYNIYIKNLSGSAGESSVFVNDVRLRFLLYPKKWPVLNLGLNSRIDSYSSANKARFNSLDLQIRKPFKYGDPSVYFKFEDKTNPFDENRQRRYELKGDWISYFKWARIRFGQSFTRNDSSPMGYVSSLDMNFSFLKIMFGFFVSTSQIWNVNSERNYSATKITDMGIRTNFGLRPFGQDYNIQFEISKSNAEEENWQIQVSISSGSISKFSLPVPFIKTKGKIRGELFIDKNGNGIRDVDEAGVSQAMLFLKDEYAVTDGDGKFEFPPVEPGEYPFSIDRATLPAYLEIAKEAPKIISIQRGSIISLQIPITSVCSIAGHVFLDENKNSKMNEKEKGMAVMRVVIQNEKGVEREAYTNEDGYYEVTDLLPGIYTTMIDPLWLPKRTIPEGENWTVVLTPDDPHQTMDLPAVNKQLEIKKTFIAH